MKFAGAGGLKNKIAFLRVEARSARTAHILQRSIARRVIFRECRRIRKAVIMMTRFIIRFMERNLLSYVPIMKKSDKEKGYFENVRGKSRAVYFGML